MAQGQDDRRVSPDRAAKSVSNETTFGEDIADLPGLTPILWRLAESVSARLRDRGLAGRVVTLKLKRADHRIVTRRATLPGETRMAERLYRAALPMLQRSMTDAPFRLIGIGVSDLVATTADDAGADLLDPGEARRFAAERAKDAVRNRFGSDAITLGRGLHRG
ncbi:hypothetical protein CNY89_08245 [Amaricoccus sp. HAR-UPW-R2A-40]|nr:hypothetical protein CNY89_08245 [Amaricoccus sp. HAR-UPW-R2A-40]